MKLEVFLLFFSNTFVLRESIDAFHKVRFKFGGYFHGSPFFLCFGVHGLVMQGKTQGVITKERNVAFHTYAHSHTY